MLCIEVNERRGLRVAFRLPPHLTKHSNIWLAHQHLSQHIQAVSRVDPHNVLGVDERPFAFHQVVIVVPLQSFSKEILLMSTTINTTKNVHDYQTMHMMQSF